MTSNVNSLPDWLYEAIEDDAPDEPLNKRAEPRHLGRTLVSAWLVDDPDQAKFSVKIVNVSAGGIGMVTRMRLEESTPLRLAPDWMPADAPPVEPIDVVVIHCTQTVQGYKVGVKMVG